MHNIYIYIYICHTLCVLKLNVSPKAAFACSYSGKNRSNALGIWALVICLSLQCTSQRECMYVTESVPVRHNERACVKLIGEYHMEQNSNNTEDIIRIQNKCFLITT